MSLLREHPLSVIKEATERSDSDCQSSHSDVVEVAQEYPQHAVNVDTIHALPRGSIFSSETSYGELLPPGQSAFRGLGLGVSLPSMYEKSLPSLPRSSIAKTASARSAIQAESARGSLAKSESSRHSFARSRTSIHSAIELESPRHGSTAKLSDHSSPFPQPESANDRSIASEPIASTPPSLPSKSSSSSTPSSVTTTTSSSSRSSFARSVSSQTTLRTFDDVIDEVTTSLALRTKMRSETVATSEHIKIGVCSTMSHTDNERFMRILATKVHQAMTLQHSYLFALIPNPVGGPVAATLVFCGAPQYLVTKASILAGLRFKTRLAELQDATGTWIGHLEPHVVGDVNFDSHVHDEDVLWDIVRKAANPIDPTEPPPGSRGVDQLLSDVRARLDRLNPSEAFKEAVEDGILVDIRTEAQRAEHGGIPGAVIIERNVLEWRFDPRCLEGRLPIADRYDLRVIVYCQEGYTSSLAAAALQDIGLWRATDIEGGFARWKSEGLPTIREDTRWVSDL